MVEAASDRVTVMRDDEAPFAFCFTFHGVWWGTAPLTAGVVGGSNQGQGIFLASESLLMTPARN